MDSRASRSEEHTSELQSPQNLVCRLLLEKKNDESGSARIMMTADPSVKIPRVLAARAAAPASLCAPIGARPGVVYVGGLPFLFFKVAGTPETNPLSQNDALPF